jgi:Fe-S-cluster-containing dehydrogenase component
MSDHTAPTAGAEPAPPSAGRRDFLEQGLRLAGGAVAFLAVARAEGSPASPGENPHPEGYDWNEHRYAYVIDTEKCIGCGSCVRACRAENDVPDGFYRTWIERYVVGPEGSYVDSPSGGIDGFPPAQTGIAATKSFFVPKMCMHCKSTPCVQVCPVGASYRTRDGVVMVDDKSCIGCGYCVQACPYGSRFLNPVSHTAEKCTWCYHRITKGLRPACVEVCPTGTRLFGDMKREDDPVRKIIERERVAILQPHLLTEPQCFYLHLDKEVR